MIMWDSMDRLMRMEQARTTAAKPAARGLRMLLFSLLTIAIACPAASTWNPVAPEHHELLEKMLKEQCAALKKSTLTFSYQPSNWGRNWSKLLIDHTSAGTGAIKTHIFHPPYTVPILCKTLTPSEQPEPWPVEAQTVSLFVKYDAAIGDYWRNNLTIRTEIRIGQNPETHVLKFINGKADTMNSFVLRGQDKLHITVRAILPGDNEIPLSAASAEQTAEPPPNVRQVPIVIEFNRPKLCDQATNQFIALSDTLYNEADGREGQTRKACDAWQRLGDMQRLCHDAENLASDLCNTPDSSQQDRSLIK